VQRAFPSIFALFNGLKTLISSYLAACLSAHSTLDTAKWMS
jgi:hypothetical protein